MLIISDERNPHLQFYLNYKL